MTKIVLLDASPLGMISNPSATPANLECYHWMESLLMSGYQIIVPEIADYEVRRELLRAGKTRGLARLDLLKNTLDYLPLTTAVMLKAADLWAQSQKSRHTDGRRESVGLRRDFSGAGFDGKRHRRHRKRRASFFVCRSKRLAGYFTCFLIYEIKSMQQDVLLNQLRARFLRLNLIPESFAVRVSR